MGKKEEGAKVIVVTTELVGSMIAEALSEAGFITEELAGQKISEALNGLVTAEALDAKLDGLLKAITEQPSGDELKELLKGLVAEAFPPITGELELVQGEALAGLVTEERVMELIKAAMLNSHPAPGESVTLPDGTEEELFDESLLEGLKIDGRPMTTDDILSGTKNADGVVTIVTRAGQKLTLGEK